VPAVDATLNLAQAAKELGVSVETLRRQIQRGRFHATLVGTSYVTTRIEVERYRRDPLGRAGPSVDDAPKTDMNAEGDDGQVYGG
jgi:excisionase family DNA binding protein